jgi:type II secretory pathway component PulM
MSFSFDRLSERERRMVTLGAIAVVLILIVAIVLPLNSTVAKAQNRVAQKQADLIWMQRTIPELAAAGPAIPRPEQSQESLLITVDRTARESGLAKSLTSSEPSGTGLRIRLEKAPFDIVVGWLARLADQNGVRVESASIDKSGDAGVVNAGLVLQTN